MTHRQFFVILFQISLLKVDFRNKCRIEAAPRKASPSAKPGLRSGGRPGSFRPPRLPLRERWPARSNPFCSIRPSPAPPWLLRFL